MPLDTTARNSFMFSASIVVFAATIAFWGGRISASVEETPALAATHINSQNLAVLQQRIDRVEGDIREIKNSQNAMLNLQSEVLKRIP